MFKRILHMDLIFKYDNNINPKDTFYGFTILYLPEVLMYVYYSIIQNKE